MQYPGITIFQFIQRTLLKDAKMEGNLWENARFILAEVPLNREEARRIMPWA